MAEGSPGLAVSLDLESYDRRRAAMLALLEVASGIEPFGDLAETFRFASPRGGPKNSIPIWKFCTCCSKTCCGCNTASHHPQRRYPRPIWRRLPGRVSFDWLRAAVAKVDELMDLVRRNIQKSLALDALAVELRSR